MQRKMFTWIALVSVALLVLGGCGSNKDSSGSSTSGTPGSFGTDANGIVYVGASTCIGCHEDFSWSSDVVAKFLEGKHVLHSTHVEASSEELCLSCHDPIGDGTTLDPIVQQYLVDHPEVLTAYQDEYGEGSYPIPADGLAAVTCEDCHGAGGQHYGVGPIPDATPDYNACGQCHNDRWTTEMPSHITYHPEGNNIVEDYEAGAHINADSRNEPICVKCHNDEGARKYKDVTTYASLAATLPIEGEVHAVQCRTCHDPHNPGVLLKPEETTGHGSSAQVVATTEYATCKNCHQAADAQLVSLTDSTGAYKTYAVWAAEMQALAAQGITEDGPVGDLIYHSARYSRVISSTHFDNPLSSGLIEGYLVQGTSERACRDCHNVHSADITINEEWARSGHGGDILGAKEAVNADSHTLAGAVDYRLAGTTAVWSGHSWPTDGEAACQRCHTATGAKNFLSGPDTYYTSMNAFIDAYDADPAQTEVANPNDFSYLIGSQQELLFCWACHSNNVGALRTAGNTMPLEDRDRVIFATIPDIGNSTVCTACHGGRGNNDTIRAASRSSRFVPHHGPAAGTVFSDLTHTAFEFEGVSYASPSFFEHSSIGLNGDTPESGAGPCASCHMPSANHTWEPITVDETTGDFTAINAQAVCNTCHTGTYAMTPALLQEQSEGFDNAVTLLGDYLANTITNYLAVDVTANYSDATLVPENAYGAFQDWKYGQDEPAAYVHNRFYAKRVIFDSIDWMDNGALDGTITIDATAYPGAAAWFGVDATNVATRP